MAKIEFNHRMTYYIGARYKHGPYSITDKETGEVKEGVTDKWRLFFITPIDRRETNVVEVYGSSFTYFDVKSEDLCFLFGMTEKEFKTKMLDELVGSPVQLDIAVTLGSNGRQSASLRGIIPID